jgi:hypothetical protein
MPANLETRLMVNELPVELNEFAHGFITNIVVCAASMLKGGQEIQTLSFALVSDKPSLIVNDKVVPLSPFPRDALRGTFRGMVSSLRGVDKIDSIRIEMKDRGQPPPKGQPRQPSRKPR